MYVSREVEVTRAVAGRAVAGPNFSSAVAAL